MRRLTSGLSDLVECATSRWLSAAQALSRRLPFVRIARRSGAARRVGPAAASALISLFLSSGFCVSPALAGTDDCPDCISRKQNICAEECDSVEPSRTRTCQKRCIAGYCSHRCPASAPELLALTEESCDACLDRQYSLCEKHCPNGTPRVRALCQIGCTETRCSTVCKNAAELAKEREEEQIARDRAAAAAAKAKAKSSDDDDDLDAPPEDSESLDAPPGE